jgi:hypothetical protein
MAVSCRVDFRAVTVGAFGVHTGRLQFLSATGCTIRTGQHLQSGHALELWMYLPGLISVLHVNHGKVTGVGLNEMSVAFVALAIGEQLRLGDYLADENFVVDARGGHRNHPDR